MSARDAVRRALGWLAALLLLAPAAFHLVGLARIFAARAVFPLDIHWLEGGEIYHGWRILHGQPVYRLGDGGFLPYPYPPVHFALLAAVGKLFGFGYAATRGLSIAAFALAMFVLAREARHGWQDLPRGASARVKRAWSASIATIAVACVAAAYADLAGWFDVVRNDSVGMALVVLGAAPLTRARVGFVGVLASSVAFSAAVYTRQTHALFAIAASIYLVARRGTRVKAFVLAAAMLVECAITLVALQHATGGAFATWLFNTGHHAVHPERFAEGMIVLAKITPFAAALPVAALLVALRVPLAPRTALWLTMLAASLPVSLLPYAKDFGYVNNMVPVVILGAPTALILAADGARAWSRPHAARAFMILLLVGQSFFLSAKRYDLARWIPTTEDRRRADALNAAVAGLEGDVLCPIHTMVPLLAGHPESEQASFIAYLDAHAAGMPNVSAASYGAYLLARRPQWVLLTSRELENELRWLMRNDYVLDRELDAPSNVDSSPTQFYRLR